MTQERESQALYRFFDAAGQLLYVGITSELGTRWRSHNRHQPWWRDVATATVEHFDTREDAVVAEVKAIASEGPVWNVKHRPGAVFPATRTAGGLGAKDDILPSEAARLLNVSTASVRRWEETGVLVPSRRLPGSTHRRYSRGDVEALRDQLAKSE